MGYILQLHVTSEKGVSCGGWLGGCRWVRGFVSPFFGLDCGLHSLRDSLLVKLTSPTVIAFTWRLLRATHWIPVNWCPGNYTCILNWALEETAATLHWGPRLPLETPTARTQICSLCPHPWVSRILDQVHLLDQDILPGKPSLPRDRTSGGCWDPHAALRWKLQARGQPSGIFISELKDARGERGLGGWRCDCFLFFFFKTFCFE